LLHPAAKIRWQTEPQSDPDPPPPTPPLPTVVLVLPLLEVVPLFLPVVLPIPPPAPPVSESVASLPPHEPTQAQATTVAMRTVSLIR
jgi:hypothetical protein